MKHLTSRADVSMLSEPYRSIVSKALAKDPAHRHQSPYDLLLADDMPRTPSVRFIGDGKTVPRLPDVDSNRTPPVVERKPDPKPVEEVHRIDAEESVFYIGPETKPTPPPVRGLINERLRANWAAIRGDAAKVGKGARRDGVIRQVSRLQPRVAPPAPVVVPIPAELPSMRVRVAELSSSMTWAAPASALAVLPLMGMLEIDPWVQPEKVAFLFIVCLLATWMNLASTRLLEGMKRNAASSRLLAFGSGAVAGLGGVLFAKATEVQRLHRDSEGRSPRNFGRSPERRDFLRRSASSSFLGLVNVLGNLPRYAARDRRLADSRPAAAQAGDRRPFSSVFRS